jgi:fatty acid desaturase
VHTTCNATPVESHADYILMLMHVLRVMCVLLCRKHSHRRHHSNTGNVAKDEVRTPGQLLACILPCYFILVCMVMFMGMHCRPHL